MNKIGRLCLVAWFALCFGVIIGANIERESPLKDQCISSTIESDVSDGPGGAP